MLKDGMQSALETEDAANLTAKLNFLFKLVPQADANEKTSAINANILKQLKAALPGDTLWRLQKKAMEILPEEYADGQFDFSDLRFKIVEGENTFKPALITLLRKVQARIPILKEM